MRWLLLSTIPGCMLSAETGPLRPPADGGDAEADGATDAVVDADACACASGRRSIELGACCAPRTECPSGYSRATHTDCAGGKIEVCVDLYNPACL